MKKFNFLFAICASFPLIVLAKDRAQSLTGDLISVTGIDLIINIIFAVLVSASWSAIKGHRNLDGFKSLSALIFGRCFLGAVVGVIAFAITESYDVDNWLQIAIVGISAWGGEVIPDTLLVKVVGSISGAKNDRKD